MSIESPRETTPSDGPFKVGTGYRVRKTFTAPRDHLMEGEVLTYERSAYSIYHGCRGYFFLDSTGRIRSWDVYDNRPVDVWEELFEELGKIERLGQ